MTDYSYKIEQTEKDVKNAFTAGCIFCALTFLGIIASYLIPEFNEKLEIDFWNLIDVFLIGGLTYGIYKQNRFAALALTIYYIINKIATIAITGKASGFIISFVFIYFFVKGTVAAFKLHGIRKQEVIDEGLPAPKKGLATKVLIWLGGIVGVVFITLIVIGLIAPDTKVLKGTEISDEYLDFVYDNGLLDEEEQVLFWYSDGFFSFRDGFYLLTRNQVIIYRDGEIPPSTHIPLTDLKYFEFYDSESEFSDSTIKLTLNNGEEYSFPVSNELGRGQEFFDRIALQNDIKVEGIE